MFNVTLKQHQFIQANARWLNEMLVVFFCSLGPFLSQISLLGIETITSALEHHVYVLTLTELHPHGWSGICLAPQRNARCKHVSRNKLSRVASKPLCFTWNHGQDTEKKISLKYFCAPDAGRWRASFTTSAAPHETGLSTIPAQTIPAWPD